MQLLEDFARVFQAPDFVKPYLHLFATGEEMRLVVMLDGKSLTGEEIAALLQKSPAEMAAFLDQAFQRRILNRESEGGKTLYRAATFYDRLDHYAKYGNYYVIPRKVRKKLDEWCFEEYIKRNDYFKKVLDNDPEYEKCHNEWVLLVHEVEEMIDAAASVRVLPCNCKMLADNCDFSREICLQLEQKPGGRTEGRELTKEEAKRLVRKLDREGLMHTGGPPNWKEAGPGYVCNCCACCCYPFRAARRLGTKGKWPKSRYVARYDREKCHYCGLCTKRCHFGAFYQDGTEIEKDGIVRKNVAFNPDLCWGCGLCANACPGRAITMERI